ncbi:Cyclic nucleotide-binding domain-containing protein [Lentzea waywayandensis]|uniref:Cyclic nucleotide-binding domain-containing protein n=1 Tax=Lentzea waywayandensis TaxID=84724 RepID=A0A1I6D9H7_9PSEU|nr:cyclic nucleotide-binding domain-containing protein [Lentzea waywayandensis]SFR02125.1 Cyclic nucleotide-binding domain-containing protein [Lentzea waywayandensis]
MTIPMADLDTLPLLTNLSHTQRAAVAGVSRIESYDSGTRLFEEGGLADQCWVVLSGCVVVDTVVPSRGRVAVQSIGPGELLGWSWLVPPYRWHFGATVVSPTRAAVVDTGALRQLADEDPAFGYQLSLILIDALLNRLQATRLRLLDLYGNPA